MTIRRIPPPSLRPHLPFLLLLAIFLSLAAYYSGATPMFESPDEFWHYNFVRDVAVNHGLPVVNPQVKQSFAHEGLQPPLYYMFGALLVGWIDQRELEKVPTSNPYALIGEPAYATNDNRNAFVHTAAEEFPYRGSVLAVHLLRLYSVLLGAGTVIFTYLLAAEILSEHAAVNLYPLPLTDTTGNRVDRFGDRLAAEPPAYPRISNLPRSLGERGQGVRDLVPLLAAAFAAFLPQFLFVSGAINNDNLANMLSAAALWQLARIVNRGLAVKNAAVLGLFVGGAALAKVSTGALAPLVLSVVVFLAWRRREWINGARVGLVFVGLVALVAGWWYLRNLYFYGEFWPFTVLADLVGARPTPLDLFRWWAAEGEGLRLSSWGVFGWFNILAAAWFYLFYDALALLAVVGLAIALLRRRISLSFSLAILPIWIVLCIIALWRYSSMITSTQGRLLFPALSAWAVLWALGISSLAPQRLRSPLSIAIGAALFIPAVLAPPAFIAPAYSPTLVSASTLPGNVTPLDRQFGNGVEWVGASVDRTAVREGEGLTVTIYQRILASPPPNSAIFVHVLNSADVIVAQRDSLIASGNLVKVPAPYLVADSLRVAIPLGVPTPDDWRVEMGMYDPASGDRLAAVDSGGRALGNVLTLTGIAGQAAAPGEFDFDFDGRARLAGARFDRAAVARGGTLRLTLNWSVAATDSNRYHVFAHALGENDHIWAASDEALAAPATTLELPFDAATPPGVYPLEVGVYPAPDGDRLAIFDAHGQDQGDHLFLGPVRVTP